MSRKYANVAAAALAEDSVIREWATGGILNRDPRRSGPNETSDAFTTTPDGDIKPVIGIVDAMGTKAFSRVQGAVSDAIEVRIFTPDFYGFWDEMDAIAERIIRLLNGYRASNEAPGVFQYVYRMGIQNGGAFVDVAYTEIAFDILSLYPRLEAA